MKKIMLFLLVATMLVVAGGCGPKRYKNENFMVKDDMTAITYETKDNNVNWGAFQKNKDELNGNCVELHAEYIISETKEDFIERVQRLKNKLDVMQIPYALGYSGQYGHDATIRIDADKIGLPVLALWNVDSAYENKIVSPLADFKAPTVEKMTYKLGDDNKYIITVDVPESYQKDFKEFCEKNVGEKLYLKLGDITFSSVEIAENMHETGLDFKGLEFLGNASDESKYESVMKLAEYVINNEYKDYTSTEFSLNIEGDTIYGIPYVTEFDKYIIGIVNEKYPDVEITRRSVENQLLLRFVNSDKEVLTTEDYINKIADIYQMCNFDDGAYSTIHFSWYSKILDNYTDTIYFTKYDGKMICYPGERVEDYVKANEILGSHIKETDN